MPTIRKKKKAVKKAANVTKRKRVRLGKYHAGNLIPMFRKAAALRNDMLAAGFTDNGGAIHSAERILNMLGPCLNYAGVGHVNNVRHYEKAIFSIEALAL